MKFSLLTMRGSQNDAHPAQFSFFLFEATELQDPDSSFHLTANDIAILNPKTLTCPIFRSKKDTDLNKTIYRNSISFGADEYKLSFQPKIDMTDEVGKFFVATEYAEAAYQQTRVFIEKTPYIRLYESKLMWQYDHRFATFLNCVDEDFVTGSPRRPSKEEQENAQFLCLPRYYVPETLVETRYSIENSNFGFLCAVRRLTNSTNERTAIFSIL